MSDEVTDWDEWESFDRAEDEGVYSLIISGDGNNLELEEDDTPLPPAVARYVARHRYWRL